MVHLTVLSPVAVTYTSDFVPVSGKEFLDIQATIECGFTLKRIRDMIRTYSQMHCTDKYSQHTSIISPVWLNGWVFVYELSGCGFESSYSHFPLLLRELGFVINREKSAMTPTQMRGLLGVEKDAETTTISLPQQKVQKIIWNARIYIRVTMCPF